MYSLVRIAKIDELKIIQDLNYELFVHDQIYDPLLNMKWPYEAEGLKYFTNIIQDDNSVCLVAEIDGKVTGYLAGRIINPYAYRIIAKQSELENMLVKEGFRGEGLGSLLVEQFIKWSRGRGVERIKVSAAAGNANAIRLYKRVGFSEYAAELEYEIT